MSFRINSLVLGTSCLGICFGCFDVRFRLLLSWLKLHWKLALCYCGLQLSNLCNSIVAAYGNERKLRECVSGICFIFHSFLLKQGKHDNFQRNINKITVWCLYSLIKKFLCLDFEWESKILHLHNFSGSGKKDWGVVVGAVYNFRFFHLNHMFIFQRIINFVWRYSSCYHFKSAITSFLGWLLVHLQIKCPLAFCSRVLTLPTHATAPPNFQLHTVMLVLR